MRRVLVALVLVPILAACADLAADGPAPPTAIADSAWRIASVNGREVPPAGRLEMAGGFITGTGPCNTIRANYIGPLPAFQIEALSSTNRPCESAELEQEIISALLRARQAEVVDGRLHLMEAGTTILVFDAVS
ncbi:MAG: META domain-containing protein [Pseudomonadota bacterium]